MKKVILSIVLGMFMVGPILGSTLDNNPKLPKKVYILRLSKKRAVKTKLVGSLKHSVVYSGMTQDSSFTVFIPLIPGNGGLDFDRTVVEIRERKKIQDKDPIRIVRFDE